MAKAINQTTTGGRGALPLSTLFTDPVVAAAFRRAEDDGVAFAVPSPRPLTLVGGAAETREVEHV